MYAFFIFLIVEIIYYEIFNAFIITLFFEQQFPNAPLKNATLMLTGMFLAFILILAFSFVIGAIPTLLFQGMFAL
jgi:sterol desaturase/sphingolipid hydroxylase (fatty acid hydroxylase superfamily)